MAGVQVIKEGDTVTINSPFTIEVNVDSDPVTVTVSYPAGVQYDSHVASGGSTFDGTTWTLSPLQANTPQTLSVTVLVDDIDAFSSGTRTVTGVADTLPGEVNISNNTQTRLLDGVSCADIAGCSVNPHILAETGTTENGDSYLSNGFYDAPSADANLTDASPTVSLLTGNQSSGAYAFLVAGAGGAASGGTGTVEIEISGNSVDDTGTVTTSDTEVIVADITTASTDEYFESTKRWVGPITYTIQNAPGSTHTTFSFDFNYGFVYYQTLGDRDYILDRFTFFAWTNSADSPDFQIIKHSSTGWTYAATGFVPGPPPLYSSSTDYGADDDWQAGGFIYRRTGLSDAILGSSGEGLIFKTASAGVAGATLHVEYEVTF